MAKTNEPSRPTDNSTGKTKTVGTNVQEAAATSPKGTTTTSNPMLTGRASTKLPTNNKYWGPADVQPIWETLFNQAKAGDAASANQLASILQTMATIPGFYKPGQAPVFRKDPITGGLIAPTYRQIDFDNMSKVLGYANMIGLGGGSNPAIAFSTALGSLSRDPQSAIDFFGKPAVKKISLTSKEMAGLFLADKFNSIFDSKPTKDEITQYTNTINAAEKKAKGAGVSQLEADSILDSIIEQRATGRTKRAIAGKETKPGIIETGSFGTTIREIRSAYADNGIQADDNKIYKEAIKSIKSPDSLKNVKDNIAMHAEVQYPAFAPYFKAGKTASDMLSPYVAVYANTYGIPENQVKLSDLKFVARDAAKAMSTEETETYLMRQPDYLKTEKYKTGVIDGLKGLARSFGIGQ